MKHLETAEHSKQLRALADLINHFGADLHINEDYEITVDFYDGSSIVVHLNCLDLHEVWTWIACDRIMYEDKNEGN